MTPKHENIWVPLSAQKKAPMAKGLLIRTRLLHVIYCCLTYYTNILGLKTINIYSLAVFVRPKSRIQGASGSRC